MQIIIVRHAEPDYAKDSLTEKGFAEADFLAERLSKLDVKDFYCSPLGRAVDTARPTLEATKRTAVTLDWLREFTAKVIDPATNKERIPWDLMPKYLAENPQLFDKDNWINTGIMQSGNLREKYTEVCQALDELIAKYGYVHDGDVFKVEKESTDTIVLFCHFGLECVLLSHILNVSPVVLWHGFAVLPSGVTTLVTEEREQGIAYFRCNGLGDLSHLYAKGEPASFAARFCEVYSDESQRH